MKVLLLGVGHGGRGRDKNGMLNNRRWRWYVSLESGQGLGWVILEDHECTRAHVKVRNGLRDRRFVNLTWVARVNEEEPKSEKWRRGGGARNQGERKRGCDAGTREVNETNTTRRWGLSRPGSVL
jgi:hypothetical protein